MGNCSNNSNRIKTNKDKSSNNPFNSNTSKSSNSNSNNCGSNSNNYCNSNSNLSCSNSSNCCNNNTNNNSRDGMKLSPTMSTKMKTPMSPTLRMESTPLCPRSTEFLLKLMARGSKLIPTNTSSETRLLVSAVT